MRRPNTLMVALLAAVALTVSYLGLQITQAPRSSSMQPVTGSKLAGDLPVSSGGPLQVDPSDLQKRLAMAQERLRQSVTKVQGARQVSAQVEQAADRGRYMQQNPVRVEMVNSWEEWRPADSSWFGARPLGESGQGGGVSTASGSSAGGRNELASLELRVLEGGQPKEKLRLKPSFSKGITSYKAFVRAGVHRLELRAQARDEGRSRVYADGQPLLLGRGQVGLASQGVQRLELRVTSEDGGAEQLVVVHVWEDLPKGTPVGNYISARRGRAKDCAASTDCQGRQVCSMGRCRCPVLYQGSSSCAPSARSPKWCLWPLGAVDLPRLFDMTHENTLEEITELRGLNRPAYSRELATSKYYGGPGSRSLDLLLHAANKLGKDLATREGSRKDGGAGRALPKAKVAQGDLTDSKAWGIDWGTCAVVGAASGLARAGLGGIIDDHTAVIRVGDAPTVGHERDTGQRTSIRRQSPETAGFSEGRGFGRHGSELCVVNIRSEKRGDLGLDGSSRCTYLELSPQFEQYMRYMWRANPPVPGKQPDVSTWSPDFTALALALHLCGRVDVFGLDLGGARSAAYYAAGVTSLSGTANAGNRALEGQCFTDLQRLPEVTVFV